jgi:hypothetical protein
MLYHTFQGDCQKLIADCYDDNLPKRAVQATINSAAVVHAALLLGSFDTSDTGPRAHIDEAKELLSKAQNCCETQKFDGAADLACAVEQYLKLLGKTFYEAVTDEELQAIKDALLRGAGGLATHSGHWSNCTVCYRRVRHAYGAG